MQSPNPTPEWLSQWTRSNEQTDSQLRHLAASTAGLILPRVMTGEGSVGLDGTLMRQRSIKFIAGNREREVTIVLRGYPDRGADVSVHSLLGVSSGGMVPMNRPFGPAIAATMATVAECIERMKAGEEGQPFLAN